MHLHLALRSQTIDSLSMFSNMMYVDIDLKVGNIALSASIL
jgi:hypothetical protein